MRHPGSRHLVSALLLLLLVPLTASARWYDVHTGRFLSQDPIGAESYLATPNELNPWGYARGNPLGYTDPTGECSATAVDKYGQPRWRLCLAESQQREGLEKLSASSFGSPEYQEGYQRYLAGLQAEEQTYNDWELKSSVSDPVFFMATGMVVGIPVAGTLPAATTPWLSGSGVFFGSMSVTEAVRDERLTFSPVRALLEGSTENLLTVSKFETDYDRYGYAGVGLAEAFLGFLGAGSYAQQQGQPLFSPAVSSKARATLQELGSLRVEVERVDLNSNVKRMAFGPNVRVTRVKSVRPYEVDTYENLKARSRSGDGLDLDHQPSHASNVARAEAELERPLTPDELSAVRNQGMAVAVPNRWHRTQSTTYGGRNTVEQIQADAANPRAAVARDTKAMINGATPAKRAAAEAAARKLKAAAKKL